MTRRAPVFPCTTLRPDESGNLAVVAVERRPRLPFDNGWEPDTVTRALSPEEGGTVGRYRVMAEQETGEEELVGEADTVLAAHALRRDHLRDHPEHRCVWLEPI
jgi:hypothetical protein